MGGERAETMCHSSWRMTTRGGYPRSSRRVQAERPEALLYVTARRLAINRLKRRSISPLAPEGVALETTASQTPGVTQQVMARQELELLQQAVANLPEGCRQVLLRCQRSQTIFSLSSISAPG